MEITLLTISKLCAHILHKCTIELDQNVIIVSELRDKLYDIYPTLDENDYTVYWWYNKDSFHKVCDYITYFTAIRLMAERILLLVLKDSDDGTEDNESFLYELDIADLKEVKRRMKKDPYDIRTKVDSLEGLDVGLPLKLSTDSDILSYALRKYPEPTYFTSDLTFRMSCAQCIKKGWPKQKGVFTLLKDEIIDRTPPKAQKSKSKDSKSKSQESKSKSQVTKSKSKK